MTTRTQRQSKSTLNFGKNYPLDTGTHRTGAGALGEPTAARGTVSRILAMCRSFGALNEDEGHTLL
jgi:hypothetical protein